MVIVRIDKTFYKWGQPKTWSWVRMSLKTAQAFFPNHYREVL